MGQPGHKVGTARMVLLTVWILSDKAVTINVRSNQEFTQMTIESLFLHHGSGFPVGATINFIAKGLSKITPGVDMFLCTLSDSRSFVRAHDIISKLGDSDRVELFWTATIRLIPLRELWKSAADDRTTEVEFSSHPPLDGNWEERLWQDAKSALEYEGKFAQSELNTSGMLFFVKERNALVPAVEMHLVRERDVYYAPACAPYADICMPVVSRRVLLPWKPEHLPADDILANLVNEHHHQGRLIEIVDTYLEKARNDERWTNIITIFYNQLYASQGLHKPNHTFSTAARRTIIDQVVSAAALYARRYVSVDEPLPRLDATAGSSQVQPVGHGPIDWLVSAACAKCDYLGDEVPQGTITSSMVSSPHGIPVLLHCMQYEGALPSGRYLNGRSVRCRGATNDALARVLAQAHDAMLYHRKHTREKPNDDRHPSSCCYAVVTTGQMYYILGLHGRSCDEIPRAVFYGFLEFPYFPFIGHNSTVQSGGAEGGYRRVQLLDFERIVAAIVLALRNDLKVNRGCQIFYKPRW